MKRVQRGVEGHLFEERRGGKELALPPGHCLVLMGVDSRLVSVDRRLWVGGQKVEEIIEGEGSQGVKSELIQNIKFGITVSTSSSVVTPFHSDMVRNSPPENVLRGSEVCLS